MRGADEVRGREWRALVRVAEEVATARASDAVLTVASSALARELGVPVTVARGPAGITFVGPELAPELEEAVRGVVAAATRRLEAEDREQRYARHLEPLSAGMFVYDCAERRYVFASEALGAPRGYTAAELLAEPTKMFTAKALAFIGRVLKNRLRAFRNGERRRYVDELAQPCRDGSVLWTETTTYFREDEPSGHLLVCGVSRPILRREDDDTTATLVEDLQQLGEIGAWSVDPVSGDARWTDEISRIHECASVGDVDEVLRQFPRRDRRRIRDTQLRTMETGEPFDLEVEIDTPGGRHKWLRIRGRPVFEHGRAIRIRGTTQDVTARKAIELERDAQRANLQALLDALPDVVALKDRSGRVLACNARLEHVFGVAPGSLLGKTIEDYAPTEMVERFREIDRRVLLEERTLVGEDWLSFATDGHRELVETITAPVRDANGFVVGTLRIARDVTAARAALERQRQTEEQLRAVQKLEAIGRLAGGVAHDFNNLLSVILSYTNLVAESLPADDASQEDLAEILAAGKRAEALTRQLLAFSRRQLLQATPLSLDEVVETVGNMLRRLIGEDIRLCIEGGAGVHPTKADRGQIEQVLVNLVVNARDAMPDGGRITITTRDVPLDGARAKALELPAGDYVELVVADTGSGMDEATLARIFEPFFTTKAVGRGTGLGLAMAYGIVRQSGGAIGVESAVGKGTRFAIYLPRHDGAVEAPRAGASRPREARGHETVLVVEDEAGLRTVVQRVLLRAGYEVLVAAGADEALALAETRGPTIDLVFTDVVMPGMNGGELVERLAPLCPRMKVVFTSGYTDEKLARSGVGAHTFVPKPYRPSQLTEAIRSVLDGEAPPPWRPESLAPPPSGAARPVTSAPRTPAP